MWLGRRDACATASESAFRDRLTAAPAPLQDRAKHLLRSVTPSCGGVVFFHLPKAAGSTLECFLGAQPEFACCYRGTCGLCKHWSRGRQGAVDGQCEHRDLLPDWEHGSNWGGLRTKKERYSNQFVLPFDLLRVSGRANSSSAAVLRRLRFVATKHMGPTSTTPGMFVSHNSMIVRWTYLRDVVFPPLGCRITLVTMLRRTRCSRLVPLACCLLRAA